MYNVNDKSCIEKSFVVYCILHNVGKIFVVLLLTRTNMNFCIYIGTQNGTNKTTISWRNLTKTAKSFSHIALIFGVIPIMYTCN